MSTPIQHPKEKIYEYCKGYFIKHGYAPTVREICNGTGIKSTSSVNFYMKKLFDEGTFATEHPGFPRAFRIVKW